MFNFGIKGFTSTKFQYGGELLFLDMEYRAGLPMICLMVRWFDGDSYAPYVQGCWAGWAVTKVGL